MYKLLYKIKVLNNINENAISNSYLYVLFAINFAIV